jgi:hypothetical protein
VRVVGPGGPGHALTSSGESRASGLPVGELGRQVDATLEGLLLKRLKEEIMPQVDAI